VKWLTKAAEQGDTTAKANLTWLTQQGYLNKVVPAADNTTDTPSP
jgi:TPR repeat protein